MPGPSQRSHLSPPTWCWWWCCDPWCKSSSIWHACCSSVWDRDEWQEQACKEWLPQLYPVNHFILENGASRVLSSWCTRTHRGRVGRPQYLLAQKQGGYSLHGLEHTVFQVLFGKEEEAKWKIHQFWWLASLPWCNYVGCHTSKLDSTYHSSIMKR